MSKQVCTFLVVYAGDLNRGEHLPVGILAWDREAGPGAPVHQRLLKYWGRFEALYPKRDPAYYEDLVTRLRAIKTVADYKSVYERMTPYTPFEFTDERASVGLSPEELADTMAQHFLQE